MVKMGVYARPGPSHAMLRKRSAKLQLFAKQKHAMETTQCRQGKQPMTPQPLALSNREPASKNNAHQSFLPGRVDFD